MSLVHYRPNDDTRLNRCEDIINQTQMLEGYHRKGIPTIAPSPSELARKINGKRDEIILDGLEQEFKDVLVKVKAAATTNTKVNQLSKLLLRVRMFQSQIM